MVRDYELMYIVRPELDDEALRAATQSVESLIDRVGGTVVRTTSWGRRRLAYEVDHLRDGHYMLVHLRVDGSRITDIERALTIHDTVFRHLLVVQEKGTEIEAVDPDAVPATATAGVDGSSAGEDGEDDDDGLDDVMDEPPAAAIPPVARQTAVVPASDDAADEAGEADAEVAAVPATTEEEN